MAKMAILDNMTSKQDLYSLHPSKELPTAPTSNLKNEFKSVFDTMMQSGPVSITRNRKREAILLPAELYDRIVKELEAKDPLKQLRAEYDNRFSKMQTADTQSAYEDAFAASPQELGRAAVAGASTEHVA